MAFVLDLIRRLRDERKTGRTFTLVVLAGAFVAGLDAQVAAIDLDAEETLLASGALAAGLDYAWKKLRARKGWQV